MMTLRQFAETPAVPAPTAWQLADLARAVGGQELVLKSPRRRLNVLRKQAMLESAISSNRLEGVEIDPTRVRAVVFGKQKLRDHDEVEVRGYRQALDWIDAEGTSLPVNEETIRKLHALSRGGLGDAGEYKRADDDIEARPDGGRRLGTAPAVNTAAAMRELIDGWLDTLARRAVHPLIALAAFNLNFLCIHPFQGGNGPVSRLLLLLHCYQQGLEVGRYVSLERLIEQSKDRYYETLKSSSEHWHGGKHNAWPYLGYVLSTLLDAYKEFEQGVGTTGSPRGAKKQGPMR